MTRGIALPLAVAFVLAAAEPAKEPPAPPAASPAEGPAPAPPRVLSLVWHGQACFEMTTPEGLHVAMDPVGKIGYPLPELRPDVVTVSHRHFDHANLALVKNDARVLQGISEDEKAWVPVDETVKGVRITAVPVYHDETKGSERGLDAVFVFRGADWSLAHLGDIGHVPSKEDAEKIGTADFLLLPVGGVFTIDAAKAGEVAALLKPRRMVIPMHYKTDLLKIGLAPVDPFLEGRAGVRRLGANRLEIDLSAAPPAEPETVVFAPPKAPAPPP